MTACGCDPLTAEPAGVSNPPGQPALAWRVAPHSASLRRMRAVLGADPRPAVRALALRGPDESAIALLDAWALVADAVSFYTERIAQEGFLRTATERESVRWLARTLGYELRPGVAAAAELAFTVDGTGPAKVLISAGTPVLTVPGQDQQPQTFETDADLVARATWNSIAGPDGERQELTPAGPLWLRGTGLGLRRGDPLLLVGAERLEAAAAEPAQPPPILSELDFWDLRLVDAVLESPPGLPGWTRLEQHSVRTSAGVEHPLPGRGAAVFTFAERADIFGWNALPPVPAPPGPAGQVVLSSGGPPTIDLDGDHPRLTGGDAPDAAHASWLVLLSAGEPKLCRVVRVTPAGPSDTSLPGRITRVQVDVGPGAVTARGTIALCGSVLLPADQVPRTGSVAGPALELIRTEPGLPPGRHVLVTGLSAASGALVAEPAVVVTCAPSGATMTVVLDRALADPIDPQTLRVLGNAVGCTHGETVRQVLGSGDGTANFQRFHPARGPLTYVGADGPTGAASTLRLTVDDVTWTPVPALAQACAGPCVRPRADRRRRRCPRRRNPRRPGPDRRRERLRHLPGRHRCDRGRGRWPAHPAAPARARRPFGRQPRCGPRLGRPGDPRGGPVHRPAPDPHPGPGRLRGRPRRLRRRLRRGRPGPGRSGVGRADEPGRREPARDRRASGRRPADRPPRRRAGGGPRPGGAAPAAARGPELVRGTGGAAPGPCLRAPCGRGGGA